MISRLSYVVSIILFQGFWHFILSTNDVLEMSAMGFLLLGATMLVCGMLTDKGE